MSKCVRDADRLDSLKPHYTENDISNKIEFGKKGSVNLQCTRFKTRIRKSDSQVRFPLYPPSLQHRVRSALSDPRGDRSTSGSRQTKAKSKDRSRRSKVEPLGSPHTAGSLQTSPQSSLLERRSSPVPNPPARTFSSRPSRVETPSSLARLYGRFSFQNSLSTP